MTYNPFLCYHFFSTFVGHSRCLQANERGRDPPPRLRTFVYFIPSLCNLIPVTVNASPSSSDAHSFLCPSSIKADGGTID